METLDCAVIGAGPAGLTAATYLRRYHRNVHVFDGGQSRARWIPRTHNCPGYPDGISGPDLLKRLRDQAAAHDVPITVTRIESVRPIDEGYELSDGSNTWLARTVLLATGVNDVVPDMENIDEAIASTAIRLCAICDAFEATDARIGVLAPVRRGLEHAIFLRSYSSSVTLIPMSSAEEELADDALRARAREHGVTICRACAAVTTPDEKGCSITHGDGALSQFDAIYPVLGALPESSLASDLGATLSDNGELIVDAHNQTSIEGLYAAGDVVSELNQIAVAMGHAAIAATAIHRRLPPNPRRAMPNENART